MKELRSIRQLDNRQLSQKIKYALFENIKESIHGNELLKLPKEEVLAQQLGVSRNGLRDVLTVLEEEGYISRRRSKGTIVNPKIVNSTCRLDLETELTQMIAEEGYEPGFETLQIKFVEEEDPVLGPEEKRYLLVEKVFYADNDPRIVLTVLPEPWRKRAPSTWNNSALPLILILWNSAVMIPLPVCWQISFLCCPVKILPGFCRYQRILLSCVLKTQVSIMTIPLCFTQHCT